MKISFKKSPSGEKVPTVFVLKAINKVFLLSVRKPSGKGPTVRRFTKLENFCLFEPKLHKNLRFLEDLDSWGVKKEKKIDLRLKQEVLKLKPNEPLPPRRGRSFSVGVKGGLMRRLKLKLAAALAA